MKCVECGKASCYSRGTLLSFTGDGPTQKNESVRSMFAPSFNFVFPKFDAPAFYQNPVRCVQVTGVLIRRPMFS